METRRCIACGETKPIEEFHLTRATVHYGPYHSKRCEPCWTKHRNANERQSRADDLAATRLKDKERYQRDKENILRRNRELNDRLRLLVFEAYGGAKCACCGEDNVLLLTIDHMENNGGEHRREIATERGYKKLTFGGHALHRWLRDNDFPTGYQVLCYNCNIGRYKNGGVCPHKQVIDLKDLSWGKRRKAQFSPDGVLLDLLP